MTQLANYTSTAFTTASGVAVAALATVEVRRESDGALATIYSDEAGTTGITQPGFAADANGRFSFYTLGSNHGYQVTVTKAGGGETATARNQAIGTAAQRDMTDYGASIVNLADAAATRLALVVDSSTEVDGKVQTRFPVRQTVLFSALDANGYANFLSAGAALNYNIDGAPTPLVLSFASGMVDYISTISADASNQGALVANNTNFINATRVSATAVTWGSCLIPPQYGYAFDRTQGALFNFEGANTSTSMIDDFGNTWAASGNAQLSTAKFKFGASSLLLDGTGDFITSTNFTTLGDGSWEISTWFNINALPGSGAAGVLFAAFSTSNFGVMLQLFNNAGTTHLRLFLSSDASSWNIVNSVDGTNATWTLNQWNKARLVFDSLAGTYRVYLSLNGAAETQDQTASSTARICGINNFRIGADQAGSGGFNGNIDAFRFIRAATVTATQTPAAAAPVITDHKVHYFSIPAMVMYEVTAASGSAGTNPTLTPVSRVFCGEQDTNGTVVTATRNYALCGAYDSGFATPLLATASSVTKNSNIGTLHVFSRWVLKNLTPQSGYVPGDESMSGQAVNATYGYNNPLTHTRNTVQLGSGQSATVAIVATKSGGDTTSLTNINWAYKIVSQRSF